MTMLNYYRIETCQQDVDAWLPVGIYGDTLGVLKTLAEHVWAKNPDHRPHVRIIREGAERPVLVWSGGKFRRNWLGKWQRTIHRDENGWRRDKSLDH